MSSPVAYYDDFVQRLLSDYATGNPRVEEALGFVLASLPDGDLEILDVGCGIGWSSSEIARHRQDARILGVDLSPRLVATAHSLFGMEDRIRFEVKDFITAPMDGRYDAIVLVDVYEHFPAGTRDIVHARLGALLKDDGSVILTIPTPAHQQFLRLEHPDQLQPVDEDVTARDISALGEDLGGCVVVQRVVSIWRPADYMHVLIQRGTVRSAAPVRVRFEGSASRAARIRRSLGIRWTSDSGFVAAGEVPICVATWSLDHVSETFIRAHVERLPAYVHVLQGSPLHRAEGGRSLLPGVAALTIRALARAIHKDPGKAEDFLFRNLRPAVRARLYSRYLHRHGIKVVMADYGPVAAELHAGCRRAGVPLVPHFHGFDAFEDETLHRCAQAYRAIFSDEMPVVAVSASMRRQLIALGAREDQVCLNPYGVDLDDFQPGEQVPGLVVAVGRFVDKKAPELTLLAFSKVLARVADARLVMIGDGPLRPAVERLTDALGLGGHVDLKGSCGHAEVAELMRTASVFMQHSVIASNGDREGTPVAVLEAGAAGIPVVATRHEGIADVVVHGETGLLVEEGDVDGMGDAVAELLLDPARARRLGQAARRRIEGSYSMQLSIERLWEILERAIRSGREGGVHP